MKRGDYIIAAVIAAAAVIMLLLKLPKSNVGELYAEVNYPGGSATLPLSRDIRFEPADAPLSPVIVVSGGAVYIESSECNDKICIKTGKISHYGQIIICVPARLTVKVISKNGGGYADFIAG